MELLLSHSRAAAKGRISELTASRRELMRLWSSDPWEFLTGRDLDGRPIYWTEDEKDDDNPIKPFPIDKPYLRWIIERAMARPQFMVDKARQLMVTTTLMGVIHWFSLTRPNRICLISKHKEEEAKTLLRKKIRNVHERFPQWLQEAWPITAGPATRIGYHNGSEVHGVAQNFAKSDARGVTASIVLIDEAAFQETLAESITAVLPMAAHLWVVSTPNSNGPGSIVMRKYLERE